MRFRSPSVFLLAWTLASCSSARMGDREADGLFRQGKFDEAAEHLKRGLKDQGENGRDLLLYVLDVGLSLHTAGKYKESNEYFLKADQIAEIKDYTSLATETATLLTTDQIKDYPGEDFEKVLIPVYLAINYAMLGQTEDALVEARRVNRRLELMVTEGKRKYKQNAFARYLSALLYEHNGDWNDAAIAYKKVRELAPQYENLGVDLWRTSTLSGLKEDAEKWQREYDLGPDKRAAAKKLFPKGGQGELIILYENGISPVKRPHPNFYQIPKFYPRFNPTLEAQVRVEGQVVAQTRVLHDIESTAIQNLDEKYAGLIAKKIGGVVAKEVVGAQVGNAAGSSVVGDLVRFALYASDQADLRSWNLLPRDLQIARVTLPPGRHRLRVEPIGASPLPEQEVEIHPGKKTFVNVRFVP